jgi:transposase
MESNELMKGVLNLGKVEVIAVKMSEKEIKLEIMSSELYGVCPTCGKISGKRHDKSEAQSIRDLAMGERVCYLSYQANRYKCQTCQKTFVEQVDWKS